MGGVTADWGSPCSITVDLRTNLTATYCNFTLSSLSQKIRCTTIPGASNYRYRVTGPGGYDQTWVSTDNSVYFRMSSVHALAPLSPGTTYSVSIAVDMNGGTGSFGNVCSVTTPPVLKMEELEELAENETSNPVIKIYPNPFESSLFLEFNEAETEKEIVILNQIGEQVFTTKTHQSQLEVLQDFPKGYYIIILKTANNKNKTFKAIKQ
jgi:hypothetical protein